MKKKNTKIFVFLEGTRKEKRIEKEKIQISHSSQGNRSRDTCVREVSGKNTGTLCMTGE
jgi:hypothetical protein